MRPMSSSPTGYKMVRVVDTTHEELRRLSIEDQTSMTRLVDALVRKERARRDRAARRKARGS